MSGTCSRHEKRHTCTRFRKVNLHGPRSWRENHIQIYFKETGLHVHISGQGPVMSTCEGGNEPSGWIKEYEYARPSWKIIPCTRRALFKSWLSLRKLHEVEFSEENLFCLLLMWNMQDTKQGLYYMCDATRRPLSHAELRTCNMNAILKIPQRDFRMRLETVWWQKYL
jgi:hypothetical protein